MTYLLGTICIGLITSLIVLRKFRQRQLANEGVLVCGRVIRKKPSSSKNSHSSTGVIRYEFITPRGKYIKNSARVNGGILDKYVEGSAIEIVYLKDNPWASDIKQNVDVYRAALDLPPLSSIGFG